MPSPIDEVRVATWEDAPAIRALAREAHRENGLFTLDQEKVDAMMARLLNRDHGAIGVIGVPVEAFAWVVLAPGAWYTSQLVLSDALVFVHSAHRRQPHCIRLVGWMRRQARALGVKLMTGVVSPIDTEAKCRLYRRMRLGKVGELYLVGTDHGQSMPVEPTN